MPRNRFTQALLLIAGLTAVTYLMISLYLPSSRWLIFGIDKRSGSVPTRVAIFAIDGADWELFSELANDGRIPNIKALTQGGASASLQTIQPTVSSMLWTTVATGLQPDRHGVIDFTDWAHHAPV